MSPADAGDITDLDADVNAFSEEALGSDGATPPIQGIDDQPRPWRNTIKSVE